MTFELELGEIHVWCCSEKYTRKLVEKGARLVDPAQAEYLRRTLQPAEPIRALPPVAAAGEPSRESRQTWVRDATDSLVVGVLLVLVALIAFL